MTTTTPTTADRRAEILAELDTIQLYYLTHREAANPQGWADRVTRQDQLIAQLEQLDD